MAPPEPPAEGEPRLKIPTRDPFDLGATLQLAAVDVEGWVAAFTAASRHPRGLSATHTHRLLAGYAREFPELLRYAVQEGPVTAAHVALVDDEIAAVENPVGKLFLIITTSQWESLSVAVFRREAQRGALTGMLGWRRLGRPASWRELLTTGFLSEVPTDPFSAGALRLELNPPRIWSVGEDGVDGGGEGTGGNSGRPPDLVWPAPIFKQR
jgi:hypothetical protein